MDKRGQLRSDPWHKDSFPRCFMNALVALIGSYRSGFAAQSDNNSSIDTKFQEAKFFASRPDEYRPFLEKLVATHQFQLVRGRYFPRVSVFEEIPFAVVKFWKQLPFLFFFCSSSKTAAAAWMWAISKTRSIKRHETSPCLQPRQRN